MASSPRIQGVRAVGASAVLLTGLVWLGLSLPVAARELCQFDAAGLLVAARDATDEGGLGIEIDVSDGPLVLTRVSIPAEEGAAGCWRLDLDGDRRFEIVVGVVQDVGARPPRLARFEWNGSLLETLPMADLEPAQTAGYRGGDSLEMRAGLLIRSFDVASGDLAALEKRHFRYEPDANRWIRLQALKREAAAGDKPIRP